MFVAVMKLPVGEVASAAIGSPKSDVSAEASVNDIAAFWPDLEKGAILT